MDFIINGNPHRLEFYQYDKAGGYFRISAFQGSDSFFSRILGSVSGGSNMELTHFVTAGYATVLRVTADIEHNFLSRVRVLATLLVEALDEVANLETIPAFLQR